MDFSHVLTELKHGHKISRIGWNGKGMYIYLDSSLSTHINGYETLLEPCIVMLTAQRTLQPGWLASQADILAEDWEVMPDA